MAKSRQSAAIRFEGAITMDGVAVRELCGSAEYYWGPLLAKPQPEDTSAVLPAVGVQITDKDNRG